jgi:hypothetical protein
VGACDEVGGSIAPFLIQNLDSAMQADEMLHMDRVIKAQK